MNMNQTKHHYDKPVFSSSEEPPLKRQKLADTSASSSATILLENKNKIQSSSNDQYQYYLKFRANEEDSYNIVNPATTPQISFSDIHGWQGR